MIHRRHSCLERVVSDRIAIAALLREMSTLLGIQGENPYKVRAYERAAAALEALESELDELIEGDRLTEISGVGESLAKVIKELHAKGSTEQLERLRREIPPGLVE